MKREFKKLVNKYYLKVKKDVISCGLACYDSDDLKRELDEMAHELYSNIVGQKPDADVSSPEYEEWFKKTLVFCEIMKEFGKQYVNYYTHFTTPTSLVNPHGQRD